MTRRKFSRELKIEAVKLVAERGVSMAMACRVLELAERSLLSAAWVSVRLRHL